MQIIALANEPSTVGNVNGFEVNEERQSKTHVFAGDDKFRADVDQRIATLLNTSITQHEHLQGVLYDQGDYFIQHYDYISTELPQWAAEEQRGGQRIQSILIYLNDDFGGGNTTFPCIQANITPMQGMLITWSNLDKNGACNPSTLHSSTPIQSGKKFVMTTWVRERDFEI